MTNIAVIGGGIAGISAAAALSADANVTVLEAEDALGYHASGRSAAVFEETYGAAPVRALNAASAARHEALGVLSPRGLMMLGKAHEKAVFDTDIEDMSLHRLSLEDARAMVPVLADDVAFAAYHDAAQDIDTDKLIQAYAKTIRSNGGDVRRTARVRAITHEAGLWRIETDSEPVFAQTLVNAAGPWADQIASMAGVTPIGLQPFRRSMARIPAPGGHDVSNWPLIFGPGESWYAKPDAGALLISPADEDPSAPMDAWADDMVIAEGLARWESYTTEPVTRLLTTWAGLRTFAPDRVLVLGRDPDVPDFVWAAGQGGYGFQSAPGAAAYLADHVAGRPSELDATTVAALSPARFA